jgi:hypothetical protein
MNNLTLIVAIDHATESIYIAYEISGQYFEGQDLIILSEPPANILNRVPLNVSRLTFQPFLIVTESNAVIILIIDVTRLQVFYTSSPNAVNENITYWAPLSVPNMSVYQDPTNLPDELQSLNLQEFNDYFWSFFDPPTTTAAAMRRLENIISLIVILDSRNNETTFAYNISGNYYDAGNLHHIELDLEDHILARAPVDIPRLTSNPLVFVTNVNSIIMLTINDRYDIQTFYESSFHADREPISYVFPISIPNISLYREGMDRLEFLRTLPEFDTGIWESISEQVNDNRTLRNIRFPYPEDINFEARQIPYPLLPDIIQNVLPPAPSQPEYLNTIINDLPIDPLKLQEFMSSYDNLEKIYNILNKLPEFITMHGLKVNFIPFEQIFKIQIANWIIDPVLQLYTKEPNKIITVFGTNGMTYLVKAKYDPMTNQIFPPI